MRLSVMLLVTTCLATSSLSAADIEPAAGADLAALLEGYRGLSLGEASLPVSDRTLEVGHLAMTFREGALYPLKGKGGQVLGFLFQGRGRYAYTSVDPVDLQALPVNLRRNAPLLTVVDRVVADDFEHALLFSAAPVVPDLETASGPAPPAAAAAAFQRIWKRIGQTYLPYDHLAAEARLNGGALQYVYAEIEGARETVGYTLDRVRDFRESLFTMRKLQGYDLRFQNTVSDQTAAQDGDPDATAVLKNARIEIATPDNRSGTIVSDLTFRSGRDGLRGLALQLFNNRKEESFDWAATKNALRVTRVVDEAGNPVPFSHRYHEILVRLSEAVPAGKDFHLRFETEGEVFTGMGGSRDDNLFVFLLDSWYPSPFDRSFFTYALKVRTRKPWRPVASGTTVALRESDDAYELETRSNVPGRGIAVLGGSYKVHEEKIGNVTYRVHGYAMARKQVLENMPKLADAMVRFYEAQLGPYPFEELDIVEIPSYGFGIAPSGVVLITTEAYKPDIDWLASYLSGGINNRLAHEIAHQWFPHKAWPSDDAGAWLSESFAEYLAGMAMAAMNPDERHVKGWKGMLAEWRGYAKECTAVGLDQADILGGSRAYRDYRCLVYNRGPLVLHMFHTTVGDRAFYAVLKQILDEASFDFIELDDVKAAQRAVLRTDMGWFFDEWSRKPGIPEVRVVHEVRSVDGKAVLSGRVEQAPARFVRMTIPLIVDYPGGQREVKVFVQEAPTQEFRFELAGTPSRITVDPANNNLATYK